MSTGPSNSQLSLPKSEVTHTCYSATKKQKGPQEQRWWESEDLEHSRKGHCTTKYCCCCRSLVIRTRAHHEPPFLGRLAFTGKDERWQVPREQEPPLLFCDCFLETRFPMGPGKRPKWNTKFSNSRICSPTVSQHTDFSKGITGYQPVSEGALQMRLALLPGEGVTGWHRHWVTEAYQASMHTLPINPLQWSGKSSYCNRVRGLPGDNVNSAATSRAPSCLTLEHPLNRELMPSSSTPWQVGGTSRTSADQRPCHVSALLWPGLTRALLCDAMSHQVHRNNQQVLLALESAGNHAVPHAGEHRDRHKQILRKFVHSKHRCSKPTTQQKLGMIILQNTKLPPGYMISYPNPYLPFRSTNSPELNVPFFH